MLRHFEKKKFKNVQKIEIRESFKNGKNYQLENKKIKLKTKK